MEKISLKENDLVLVDLFGKGQLYENKLDENLKYMKKYLDPKDYDEMEHYYKVERNEEYFQKLVEKDVFTLEELYQLIKKSIQIQTKNGNRVFIEYYHGEYDEEPTYTYYVGNVYDDKSEVKVGSIVEYVPNVYMQINLDYFTRGEVLSGLNGETERDLRYYDIIVELENGERTTLCMEEFLLVRS